MQPGTSSATSAKPTFLELPAPTVEILVALPEGPRTNHLRFLAPAAINCSSLLKNPFHPSGLEAI